MSDLDKLNVTWSRPDLAARPDPTPEGDRPVDSVKTASAVNPDRAEPDSLAALPEKMPTRTPERRWSHPVEIVDGEWKVASPYSRRRHQRDLADPAFDINSLLPK